MKTNKCLGLLAALVLPLFTTQAQTPAVTPPPGAGSPPAVSPGAAEVIKMAEAGTSDDVLLAYVKNSTSTFDLSADQILYLRDIGISSPVITGMLARDTDLRSQAPAYTYDQKLYPATVPPPAAVAPEQAPAQPAPVAEPAPAAPPVAVEAPLTPPATYVSSPPPEVSSFYEPLAPYGTWVQLDGVGWCWQPRVVIVNRGWRPYCDSGHWVYTDAGWFWQSDYSWGWAPFHYGRWQLSAGCGWVWLPDRVWGPAWVTWRSQGDYCGWAPLPPRAEFDVRFGYRFNGVHVGLDFDFGLRPDHFTFIALHDFHDHDFARRSLPRTQVTQIYNHTTIINNYVVQNNTVINQGIQVDRVSAATHTQFRKVAIRDVPAGSPAIANSRVTGKTEVAVYRPQLKAPERPVNMVAQKVDARHPVIQHSEVVAAKPQRPLVSTTPPNVNHGVQGQTSGTFSRPSTERAPAYTPPASHNQKSYRTSSSTVLSSPAASSARTEQARPVTPPSTPPSRVPQERSVAERSPVTTSQPNTPRQTYPSRPEAPAFSPETSRPAAPVQNSHTYYPKGYYQSQDTRVMPSANGRSSEAHPQPSMSSHPSGPPDSNGRGQGGSSRKNEQ